MSTSIGSVAIALALLFLATAAGACGGGSRGDAQPGDPCADTEECIPDTVCFDHVCVGDGALRFSMSWAADTDIDLHVLTPAGEEIYYASRTAGGGTLDVDDCVGEACATPGATHVENVVFDETALAGTYTYWSENYAGNLATSATIEVFVGGGSKEAFTDALPAVDDAPGPHHPFVYGPN